MEPKTLRYAAVPTLPLSGGKLNTVMASRLSNFFLCDSLRTHASHKAGCFACTRVPQVNLRHGRQGSAERKATGSTWPS